jgi:hypothetical protein
MNPEKNENLLKLEEVIFMQAKHIFEGFFEGAKTFLT